MARYLISFDDGWMTFPEEDLPDVAKAALEVVQEAEDAGVWVYGAGLERQQASIVAPDLGTAYLGTQGDEWDAQQDMALAAAGSALAMLILRFKYQRRVDAR